MKNPKKATERVLGKKDPHRITIEVPVLVSFSTDPAEMDDRKSAKKPTRKSLLDYLYGAFRLEIDTESEGQPAGAVFAAAEVDWKKAKLSRGYGPQVDVLYCKLANRKD